MLLGLGKHKKPFIYLDNFVPDVNWEELHSEICFGISQSVWNKKFVSSGVHQNWSREEITPFMRNIETNLTEHEILFYNKCKTVDEKLKYITALKDIPHPFWALYIRDNIRKESTGLINKHVSTDCKWTKNAKHFPSLIKLIKKMPFKSIGRVMLFMTEANNKTVPHFDGRYQNDRPNDDFIWFTTKKNTKKIFVMNSETLEKFYPDIEKNFIWFNEMDYHGTEPINHFSFSIRIDGVLKENIKSKLLD